MLLDVMMGETDMILLDCARLKGVRLSMLQEHVNQYGTIILYYPLIMHTLARPTYDFYSEGTGAGIEPLRHITRVTVEAMS